MIFFLRPAVSNINIAAPEPSLIAVKLAASIVATLSASRHNTELAANASMARQVRISAVEVFIIKGMA
jgi:hypothetical protein